MPLQLVTEHGIYQLNEINNTWELLLPETEGLFFKVGLLSVVGFIFLAVIALFGRSCR